MSENSPQPHVEREIVEIDTYLNLACSDMSSADSTDRSATIREKAKECLDLFAEAIRLLNGAHIVDIRIRLQDELGRFKLWATNIGVFAELQMSLDFRLREFKDVQETFLRQLAAIESRLLQRTSFSNDSGTNFHV